MEELFYAVSHSSLKLWLMAMRNKADIIGIIAFEPG
jgi:hypothetical protein